MGTVAQRIDIDASANSTTNALVFEADIGMQRSGLFRLSLFFDGAAVATLAGEAPIFLTVLPGPPVATASQVYFNGVVFTRCT